MDYMILVSLGVCIIIYLIFSPLHSGWDIRGQQSFAACCALPDVKPIALFNSSAITVRLQFVLGCPSFLLPGGVYLRAVLGMQPWSFYGHAQTFRYSSVESPASHFGSLFSCTVCIIEVSIYQET